MKVDEGGSLMKQQGLVDVVRSRGVRGRDVLPGVVVGIEFGSGARSGGGLLLSGFGAGSSSRTRLRSSEARWRAVAVSISSWASAAAAAASASAMVLALAAAATVEGEVGGVAIATRRSRREELSQGGARGLGQRKERRGGEGLVS